MTAMDCSCPAVFVGDGKDGVVEHRPDCARRVTNDVSSEKSMKTASSECPHGVPLVFADACIPCRRPSEATGEQHSRYVGGVDHARVLQHRTVADGDRPAEATVDELAALRNLRDAAQNWYECPSPSAIKWLDAAVEAIDPQTPRRERATPEPLGATVEGRLVVTGLCDLRATGKERLTPYAVEMLERAINLIEGRDCFPKERT